MNLEELLALKTKVDAAIKSRVDQERRRLAATLRKLDLISASATSRPARMAKNAEHAKRRPADIKYRNPANVNET